jgi:hypothetical protein
MKYTIDISPEDHSEIVAKSLRETYKWTLEHAYEEELLNGLEVVLAHYMSPSEYGEWFVTRGRE